MHCNFQLDRTRLWFASVLGLCLALNSLVSAQQIPSYKSYEDYCTKNPKAPTCINGKPITMQDMQRNAQKLMEAQRKSLYKGGLGNPKAASPRTEVYRQPVEPPTLGLRPDWAFAHPSADMLAAINVLALRESPTVRALLQQLATPLQMQPSELDNFLARGEGVNQVWISMRAGDSLMLLQGPAQFPPGFVQIGNGMTSYRIAKNAIVIGREASVLKSVERLIHPSATPSAAVLKMKRLAIENDFWTTGIPASLTQMKAPKLPTDLSGYSLNVRIRDGLTFQVQMQFRSAIAAHKFVDSVHQDPNLAQYPVKVNTTVEGVSVRVSLTATQAQLSQALDSALAGPFGAQLKSLAANMRKSDQLTIVGLQGGPKEVGSSGKAVPAPAGNSAAPGGIEIIYGSGTPH
jgi:hypothetical protein